MTAYALHPQVGLRSERTGALAYHYGNRRLTFLNDDVLAQVVRTAADFDDIAAAFAAAGVTAAQTSTYHAALLRLVDAGVLVARH